jgi:ankyrin repeat protein
MSAIVDMKAEGGWTALHVASEYGHTDVVSLLLSAGADARATDNVQWTPAHSAAFRKQLNVLKILLPCIDVSDPTDTGFTVLHFAAYYGDFEAVRLLVEFGADIWAQNKYGRTPLDLAAHSANWDGVRILLKEVTGRPLSDFEHQGPEELWRELIRQDPKNISFHRLLATLYIDAQQYLSAATELDVVLELQSPSNVNANIEEVIHKDVTCDSCDVTPIIGLRHKCLVCRDYDLCNKCFQIEPHPDPGHEYLTIPSKQWGQRRREDAIV